MSVSTTTGVAEREVSRLLTELCKADNELATLADRLVLDADTIAELNRQLDAAIKRAVEAEHERDRLRKLFDDAGQGEHNVLALVDHYQAAAMDAEAKLAGARKAASILRVELARIEKLLHFGGFRPKPWGLDDISRAIVDADAILDDTEARDREAVQRHNDLHGIDDTEATP